MGVPGYGKFLVEMASSNDGRIARNQLNVDVQVSNGDVTVADGWLFLMMIQTVQDGAFAAYS